MQRRVQFWRIVGADISPLNYEYPSDRLVASLAAAEKGKLDRNHRCTDGELIQAQAFPSAFPSLILYTLRRGNLPRREQSGVITPLVLSTGESLAEATYFSFFARNVVGVLYNQMGPSHARLEEYIRGRFNQNISIVPIYREDSMAIIDSLNVSSVRIGVPSDQVQFLSANAGQAADWVAALDDMANLSGGGVVEAGFSVGTIGPAAVRQVTRSRIKDLLLSFFASADLHRFTKAEVAGINADNERVVVNLLHDRLVQSVDVEDTPSGQLDRTSELSVESLASAWAITEHVVNALIDDIPLNASAQARSRAAAGSVSFSPMP